MEDILGERDVGEGPKGSIGHGRDTRELIGLDVFFLKALFKSLDSLSFDLCSHFLASSYQVK